MILFYHKGKIWLSSKWPVILLIKVTGAWFQWIVHHYCKSLFQKMNKLSIKLLKLSMFDLQNQYNVFISNEVLVYWIGWNSPCAKIKYLMEIEYQWFSIWKPQNIFPFAKKVFIKDRISITYNKFSHLSHQELKWCMTVRSL